MNPKELVKNIRNREDFVSFLGELQKDFQDNKGEWENTTVDSYLNAVSAWVADSDEYYINQNQQQPENMNWKAIAEMLISGKYYE